MKVHPANCPLIGPPFRLFIRKGHYSIRLPGMFAHAVKFGGHRGFWDVGINIANKGYWTHDFRPREDLGEALYWTIVLAYWVVVTNGIVYLGGKLLKYAVPLVTLALLLTSKAHAQADGTQVDGTGSPAWFSWSDFAQGSAASWVIVGPMFLYWMAKRQTANAMR